ncbi:unnamed protein product [Menidia menidia]|uniref:Large ribosomal subunit protein eL22 n=1 Tax=Menidia menidia TaxID=238744 RepID=A0A8S4BX21_9TELE|nr:unnamed protein product [Menidia menidia]
MESLIDSWACESSRMRTATDQRRGGGSGRVRDRNRGKGGVRARFWSLFGAVTGPKLSPVSVFLWLKSPQTRHGPKPGTLRAVCGSLAVFMLACVSELGFILVVFVQQKKQNTGKGGKKKKQLLKFTLDCTHPVEDGIMDAANFVSFPQL